MYLWDKRKFTYGHTYGDNTIICPPFNGHKKYFYVINRLRMQELTAGDNYFGHVHMIPIDLQSDFLGGRGY